MKKIKFIWFIVAMLILVPTVLAKSTTPEYVTPEALAQGYHDPLLTTQIGSSSGGTTLNIIPSTITFGGDTSLINRNTNLILYPTTGNVGIGTPVGSDPSYKLDVAGDIRGANVRATQGLKPGAVADSVTETGMIRLNGNYLEYYDGTAWRRFTTTTTGGGDPLIWRKNSDNTIYYSTANVGIGGPGSSAPQRTLDVYGTARFSGDTNVGGALSVGTDLTVTGNDILGSNGNALTFTAGGTTVANKLTVGTNVQVNGNIIQGSDSATRLTFANTGTTVAGQMSSGSVSTGTVSAGHTGILAGDNSLVLTNSGTNNQNVALSVMQGSSETASIQYDGTFSGSFVGDGSGLDDAGPWTKSGDFIYVRYPCSNSIHCSDMADYKYYVGINDESPDYNLDVGPGSIGAGTISLSGHGAVIKNRNDVNIISFDSNKVGIGGLDEGEIPRTLTVNGDIGVVGNDIFGAGSESRLTFSGDGTKVTETLTADHLIVNDRVIKGGGMNNGGTALSWGKDGYITTSNGITSEGDIRINGGHIRNPKGDVKIFLNSDGSVTISGNVKVTGDLEVQGNIIKS